MLGRAVPGLLRVPAGRYGLRGMTPVPRMLRRAVSFGRPGLFDLACEGDTARAGRVRGLPRAAVHAAFVKRECIEGGRAGQQSERERRRHDCAGD